MYSKETHQPHTCLSSADTTCLEHLLIKWKIIVSSWQRKESEDTPYKQLRTDDIVLLVNIPAQTETLLHYLEWAAVVISLHVNTDKTEYKCFNKRSDISTLNDCSLKLVDIFTYLRSSVSSTEKHINICLEKPWTAIDGLSAIWKWDFSDKIKRSFFPGTGVSILLNGCTTWTLSKPLEKKLDPTTQECCKLYWTSPWGNIPQNQPPITKTIKVSRTRHTKHCWRSKDELISDILQWTPANRRTKAGRPPRTYIQLLCADTGYSLEDLPTAKDDRHGWQNDRMMMMMRKLFYQIHTNSFHLLNFSLTHTGVHIHINSVSFSLLISSPSYGLNSTTTVLLREWLWH